MPPAAQTINVATATDDNGVERFLEKSPRVKKNKVAGQGSRQIGSVDSVVYSPKFFLFSRSREYTIPMWRNMHACTTVVL